jgi:hypothetical protein
MHTSVAMHLISWALVLKHSGDLLFLKAGVLFRSNQISRSINSLLGSQAEHIVPLSPYACHHNKRKKKSFEKRGIFGTIPPLKKINMNLKVNGILLDSEVIDLLYCI